LWGLNEITIAVNELINEINFSNEEFTIEKAYNKYVESISNRLTGKSGLIATTCMSIRYPHSVKGTASQKSSLPKNVIEIHRDMANDLKVSDGDFVIVERFPCLGFMSMKVQKIKITEDINSRYVISVSGSSLNSLNLDFDGDVIYLMAFRTPKANAELNYEFEFPNKYTNIYYKKESESKTPSVGGSSLKVYIENTINNGLQPITFSILSPEQKGVITKLLTMVKSGVGICVARGYALARILEGRLGYKDMKLNAQLESVLNKVANSVFSNKHLVQNVLEGNTHINDIPLSDRLNSVICRADKEGMIALGIPENVAEAIATTIVDAAKELNIYKLDKYYYSGRSIINKIIASKHQLYRISRRKFDKDVIVSALAYKQNDMCSNLFSKSIGLREEVAKSRLSFIQ
jgi:hypothetical protein